MKLYKYIFICLASILISACSSPEERPSYYYDDKTVQKLIYAIEEGHINGIQASLEAGVNINIIGKNGVTPLFWSFLMAKEKPSKKDIFKLLLKNGADPMVIYTPEGKSVLTYAAINIYDSDYLRIILEEQPDINVDQYLEKTPYYPTALYHAIFNKNYDNVKLLLEHGADVNYGNSSVRTPLSLATGSRWDIAHLLLQNGANYNHVGVTSEFNPFNRSEIVLSLENNTYWPADDPENYREKVIQFLKDKGVEVYPLYPKDDPRYNPRPPQVQLAATEAENKIIEPSDNLEVITLTAPADRDFEEEYRLTYEQEELKEVKIKSSVLFFEQSYTGTLTYTVNDELNPTLKQAALKPYKPLLNLNTLMPLTADEIERLSADDIGIIVEDLKFPISFVTRNTSIKELIKKYSDRTAIE